MSLPTISLIAFFSALLLALAIIVGLLRFWRISRGVDAGDGQRKLQEKPVLRVAGIALYASFVGGFLLIHWSGSSNYSNLPQTPFLLLGSILFFVGFADDLFSLPAGIRLLVQVGVGVSAYLYGMRIEFLTHPVTRESIELGGFSLTFTVAWFVALPNLINLVDGLDGLAGGIGLFLSLTLAVLGELTGNSALLILSLAMAGGLVAFLVFNLPPAKVYMGDGGAYLLGYFIAATSMVTSNKGSIVGALLVVVIALGFPILDTAFAIIRRALSGLPIMRPDARHLHHRLMTLGFSKRTIILVLYGVFASFCLLGLSVFVSAGYSIPIVGMLLTVTILFGMRKLGIPHTFREARALLREVIAARKDTRYTYTLAQVLEHDLDRLSSEQEYWAELKTSLCKLGIEPASADDSAPFQCSEGRCLIIQPLSEDRVWKLCCPQPDSGRKQWNRVILCLVPAITNGEARWGPPPAELGVTQRITGRGIAEWEEELNQTSIPSTGNPPLALK